jgi:hypothetical protein
VRKAFRVAGEWLSRDRGVTTENVVHRLVVTPENAADRIAA